MIPHYALPLLILCVFLLVLGFHFNLLDLSRHSTLVLMSSQVPRTFRITFGTPREH